MSTMARHLTLAAAAAVVAACQRAQPSIAPVRDLVGRYSFQADLSGPTADGSRTVAGVLQILPDSFAVQSQDVTCRPPIFGAENNPTVLELACPDFDVEIDRRYPLSKTTYSATISKTVYKTECAQHGWDMHHNWVCLDWEQKSERENVAASGLLQFRAVQR